MSTRTYGGVPTHERVAGRRARLIAAGRRLIGEEGVDGTTVRGTCRAAGLSQRYFYESFRSVEELAIAVADEITEAIYAAADDAVADEPRSHVRVRIVFSLLIDSIAADPAAGRIVFVESAGNGPDFAAWRRQMLIRAAALMEGWLREPGDREPPTSRRADQQVAALMMAGGVSETIVAWLDGEVDASPAGLADALARTVTASAAPDPAA